MAMKQRLFFLSLGIFFCFTSLLHSQPMTKHVPTARALAMGNAFTAVSDDYGALYYNPAGLGRQMEWMMEFVNPYVETNLNTVSIVKGIVNSTSSFDGISGVLDFIKDNIGEKKNLHFRLGFQPYLVVKGIRAGMSMFADFSLDMVFHRELSFATRAYLDAGVVIGYAHNFFNDHLSVGVSLRPMIRGAVDEELGLESIDKFSSGIEKLFTSTVGAGQGMGTDIGIMFTPFKKWKPTLGVVIQDIFDTTFSPFEFKANADTTLKAGESPTALQSTNIGFSIRPDHGKLYALFAVDVHAINRPDEFGKKLHMGTELGFSNWVQLGLGFNGMSERSLTDFWTAGLSLNIVVARLRLTSYAEEIGPIAGTNVDRRFLLQFKALL